MVKPQMFLNAVITIKSSTAEENFQDKVGEIQHIIVLPVGKTTATAVEVGAWPPLEQNHVSKETGCGRC